MIQRLWQWWRDYRHPATHTAEQHVYDDKGTLLFTINLARGMVRYPAPLRKDHDAK